MPTYYNTCPTLSMSISASHVAIDISKACSSFNLYKDMRQISYSISNTQYMKTKASSISTTNKLIVW